jgi:hypothetical protein
MAGTPGYGAGAAIESNAPDNLAALVSGAKQLLTFGLLQDHAWIQSTFGGGAMVRVAFNRALAGATFAAAVDFDFELVPGDSINSLDYAGPISSIGIVADGNLALGEFAVRGVRHSGAYVAATPPV